MSIPFEIGRSIYRAAQVSPYERADADPLYRPLQIYATDPAESVLSGNQTVADVPYEPLAPGPEGRLFLVSGYNEYAFACEPQLDLEQSALLCTRGMTPQSSAQFQMQMVYAVAMCTYDTFRRALGRYPHWGFDTGEYPARLRLFPCFNKSNNAYYEKERGRVVFGWYVNEQQPNDSRLGTLAGTRVYTSLSHDIIAHEVSHALLDGLRPSLLRPFHPDTRALHEALADLVAIFQRFRHRKLVETAIQKTRGQLGSSHLLTNVASQFGQTQKSGGMALRSAVAENAYYDITKPAHKLGEVLVTAVFDAYTTIFDRKTRPYIKLATNGSGVLPEGDLNDFLAEVLAKTASKLANNFLSICIRAMDYCPPVAVTFGDYLRAMLTADADLIPDDPYGYREALVDAFVKRGVLVDDVESRGEHAMLWPRPGIELGVGESDFMAFLLPQQSKAQRYEARAKFLGKHLLRPELLHHLALIRPDEANSGRGVSNPCIESARVSHRVGPDGQLETDLIAELTQQIEIECLGRTLPAVQGSTVIIGRTGKIRYVIPKFAGSYARQLTAAGETSMLKLWTDNGDRWEERPEMLRRLHDERPYGSDLQFDSQSDS